MDKSLQKNTMGFEGGKEIRKRRRSRKRGKF